MIRFRAFRNGDPPALAQLWNRALPASGVARPLSAHEFDAAVVGRLDFDRHGLVVAAEDDGAGGAGRVVGFAHAGFGPADPAGAGHRRERQLGTVAMLVTEPGAPAGLAADLLRAAEDRLRDDGAEVVYAGGQAPLDPFYRSIYGGSEFSGILDDHHAFRGAAEAAGYEPAARTVRFESDPSAPEARDPKAVLIRRMARIDVEEDAMPAGWWEALHLGLSEITRFALRAKVDGKLLATASAWDMAGYGREGGRLMAGLYDVAVPPDLRRKGYARYLVAEVVRLLRAQGRCEVVAAQTDAANAPALALYRKLGFAEVGGSTLYRRPGGRAG